MFGSLVLAALVAVESGAAWYRNEEAFYYPTAGVVRQDAGTIEATICPVEPLADDIGGWPFAFCVYNKEKSSRARTALGIFHPPRQKFSDKSFMNAIARSSEKTMAACELSPPVKAGERVNYAMTWGPGGIRLYRNGKLVSNGKFSGSIDVMSPYLEVYDRSPLYTEKIRICARELGANELASDPSAPFADTEGATLVANRLDEPRFKPSALAGAKPVVQPFDESAARVVREGDEVKIGFVASNPGDKPAKVAGEIKIGEHALPVEIEIPAKTVAKRFTASAGVLPAGMHKCEAFGFKFAVSVLPRHTLKDGALADYLGISLIPDASLVAACGIRWERLWNKHVLLWYQLEPRRGDWDFRTSDRIIGAAKKHGIKMLATLGYGPAWAVERPPVTPETEKIYSPSIGTWRPNDLPAWDTYVRTVAERYRDSIGHWEIWNEIDWMRPGRAASFSGTQEDYLELLKRAHGEIKAVNPGNKVLVSGFGTVGALTANVHSNLCEMGATDYCDIWNMHAYLIRTKAAEYREVPRRKKPGMPVWQTEFMWHVLSDPARQAYLGPAIHNWYLEEGYEKFFQFGIDYLTDRHTHSIEPSLHTIAVQQSYLAGCSEFGGRIKKLPATDFDIAHTFKRTDGTHLAMIGSSAGKYRVRFNNKPREVRDMYGAVASAPGSDLTLEGTFYYVVTDEPLEVAGFEALKANQLVPNAGFEDLAGDDLDGIDKCKFEGWEIRTQRDAGARVSISTNAISGKYSARLRTTEKLGAVYMFQPLRLPGDGYYRMTAKVRVVSGAPRAFMRLFERKERGRTWAKNIPLKRGAGETTLHFNIHVENAPDIPVAAIVGIEGQGEVIIDDVHLVPFGKVELDEDDAIMPALPECPLKLTRSKTETINLGAASPLGTGVKYFDGVPFNLTDGWLVAAGGKWQNASTAKTLPVGNGAKASEIFILAAAMYPDGERLASFEVSCKTGEMSAQTLRLGKEVRDWFLVGHPDAKPAVRWEAPGTGLEYGLFLVRWKNPFPEKEIASVRIRTLGEGITAVKAVTFKK